MVLINKIGENLMENLILQEAFQQLNMLNEEDFNISNNSEEGIEELKDFVDNDEEIDTLDIIDPETEDEEELEDSYIDKVILDCTVCHSKLYKNADEVNVDEEEGELANVGEECPYCYSSDGYKVIGQVVPFSETEVDVEVEPKEDDSDDIEDIEGDLEDIENIEEDDEDKVEESFSRQRMNEAFTYFGFDCPPGSGCAARVKDTLEKVGFTNFKEMDFRNRDYGDGLLYIGFEHEVGQGSVTKAKDALSKVGLKPVKEIDNRDTETMVKGIPFRHVSDDGETVGYSASRQSHDKFQESLEKIDIETEHDNIHVETEEKVEAGEEMIAPVEPEVEDEIMGVEDEVPMDEFSPDMEKEAPAEEGEDEFADYDLEDFDEESFDDLGESYLRNVYGNVESYKTTSAKVNGDSLVLEGVIKFNSGNEKKTEFIFEAKDATKSGKVRFVGRNPQINESKRAFTLFGRFEGRQLFSESLKYNYRQKTDEGFKRVSGTAKLNG